MTLVNIDSVEIPMEGVFVSDNDIDDAIRSWKYLLEKTLGNSVADLFERTFDNCFYDLAYEIGYEDARAQFQKT